MQFTNQTTTRFGFWSQFGQRNTQLSTTPSYILFDSYGTKNISGVAQLGAYYIINAKFSGLSMVLNGQVADLKRVAMHLKRVGTLTGNVTITLHASIDDGGGFLVPDGAALATATVS